MLLTVKMRSDQPPLLVFLVVVLVTGLVAGCSGASQHTPVTSPSPTVEAASKEPAPTADPTLTGRGSIDQRFRRVSTEESRTVTLRAPTLSTAADRDLQLWLTAGVMVSAPVEISLDGPVPDNGVTLTRTYAAPLPATIDASFVYWDPKLSGWRQVRSTLSPDRRVLTATVDHLSVWTDVLAGPREALRTAGKALQDAGATVAATAQDLGHAAERALTSGAETLFYVVGDIFDVRVDAPTCNGKPPAWVDDAVFIADDKNNPIRWCVGRDPKRADLLVVKARVNRGFGFVVTTAADPEWRWYSEGSPTLMSETRAAVADLDDKVADSVGQGLDQMTGGGEIVDGGAEIAFGFTQDQINDADGKPLVTFQPPNVPVFISTAISRQLIAAGLDLDTSRVSAALAVASCLDKAEKATRGGSAIAALVGCFQDLDEDIAKIVGSTMKTKEQAKLAGKIVGKVSAYLALIGPVFSIMNWVGESVIPESARQITVFEKAPTATVVTRLNPLTSNGSVRSGYRIEDHSNGPAVSCDYAQPSPAAVSENTYDCGSTADPTHFCWTSPKYPGRLLCLTFAWSKTVDIYRATDIPNATEKPEQPNPMGLLLSDGSRWLLRIGGSWSGRTDDLVGAYSCIDGPCESERVVLVDSPDYINKGNPMWTVRVGGVGSAEARYPTPKVFKVKRAWYLTTQ